MTAELDRIRSLHAGIEDATMPPEAVSYFKEFADEAIEDISTLPESSQPFWFRTQRGRQ